MILYAQYPIAPPITLVMRSKKEKPPIIVASCISSIDSEITIDIKQVFNTPFPFWKNVIYNPTGTNITTFNSGSRILL
jgi:uncharacterized membrane protein